MYIFEYFQAFDAEADCFFRIFSLLNKKYKLQIIFFIKYTYICSVITRRAKDLVGRITVNAVFLLYKPTIVQSLIVSNIFIVNTETCDENIIG